MTTSEQLLRAVALSTAIGSANLHTNAQQEEPEKQSKIAYLDKGTVPSEPKINRPEVFGHDIYIMNPDSTEVTNLTNSPEPEGWLSWSSDGKHIAYHMASAINQSDICVVDIYGNQRNLTNTKYSDNYPSWSPDGKRIAFISDRKQLPGSNAGLDIYTIRPDGSGETNLTNNEFHDWFNSWINNGDQILFRSSRDPIDWKGQTIHIDGIYIMNADGSKVSKNLTRTLFKKYGTGLDAQISRTNMPHWSPDGTLIAFSIGGQLHIMNSRGKQIRVLTDGKDFHLDVGQPIAKGLVWSPDGKKITFRASVGRSMDAESKRYVIDVDGKNLTTIHSGRSMRFGSWSPDSEQIVFTPSRNCRDKSIIYVMDADGSNKTEVGRGSKPVWSPFLDN